MTAEAPPAAGAPSWPILSLSEQRVLGVLVEKAKTTPDVYPLSLNSLVTGCNQKSNREPILELSDGDVEAALQGLQSQGLAFKVTGGRVDRWRHNLYEAWLVEKAELAVLAELLLRGPQTEGELRGRASRMEPIADLEALRSILKPLAERGLLRFLGEAGRRGTLIAHGLQEPGQQPAPAAAIERPAKAADTRLEEALAQIAELQNRVTALEEAIKGLTATAAPTS